MTDALVKRIGSWVLNSAGFWSRRVSAEITSALAQSWTLKDGSTLAASGVAIVNGTSLFLPYDRLQITEDGGASSVTWDLQANTREAVIRITGAGTIKIEGEINGTFRTLGVVGLTGTTAAATTLSATTYKLW